MRMPKVTLAASAGSSRRVAIALIACALGAILLLFPFDWLAGVWPAYASLFDRVFASAASHHIGHAALFGLVGLAMLAVWPSLRRKPALYGTVMLGGALLQEAIQAIAKADLPNPGDALDIVFDLLGAAVVFALVWSVAMLRRRQPATP
jgi:class 3 adenylate cyclase